MRSLLYFYLCEDFHVFMKVPILNRHFNHHTNLLKSRAKMSELSFTRLCTCNITHKELWGKKSLGCLVKAERTVGIQSFKLFIIFQLLRLLWEKNSPLLATKLFNNTTCRGKKNNLYVCSQVLALQIIHEHRYYWFTLVFLCLITHC